MSASMPFTPVRPIDDDHHPVFANAFGVTQGKYTEAQMRDAATVTTSVQPSDFDSKEDYDAFVKANNQMNNILAKRSAKRISSTLFQFVFAS